jgi:hypothetical protein
MEIPDFLYVVPSSLEDRHVHEAILLWLAYSVEKDTPTSIELQGIQLVAL